MVLTKQRRDQIKMGGMCLKAENAKLDVLTDLYFDNLNKKDSSNRLLELENQHAKMDVIKQNKFTYLLLNRKTIDNSSIPDIYKMLLYSAHFNTISLDTIVDDKIIMHYNAFKIELSLKAIKRSIKVIITSDLCRLYYHYFKINTGIIKGSVATIDYYDAIDFIYNLKIFSAYAETYMEKLRVQKERSNAVLQRRKKKLTADDINKLLA